MLDDPSIVAQFKAKNIRKGRNYFNEHRRYYLNAIRSCSETGQSEGNGPYTKISLGAVASLSVKAIKPLCAP